MTGIALGLNDLRKISIGGSTPILKVSLGSTQVWPAFDPVRATFTDGAYTFNIPAGCKFIDVILLGAGGGGQGFASAGIWGQGGFAGNWVTVTLERGVHIPMSTLQITGVIGVGGDGGAGSFVSQNPGKAGTATTALATGMSSLSAAGGAGGNNGGSLDYLGKSPGNRTYNDQLYQGGAESGDGAGNPAGGGGAAGRASWPSSGSNGGKGARGQAWFYAY
ncbi:hypothetical protein PBI_CHE12_34 [Mycobacterium phage Che12]|uniref:Glycine-rich domain-containing protein n=1 Tax=Mycobacterium phage Che12 TaxID=2911435 RepID=Q1A0I3_9CAUD|nr:minor tail protein [Mycobacterium phage Che12]ABE67353.1 hypothetical protein PBI_CHE12_34 [Mycobacterium phage Che12]